MQSDVDSTNEYHHQEQIQDSEAQGLASVSKPIELDLDIQLEVRTDIPFPPIIPFTGLDAIHQEYFPHDNDDYNEISGKNIQTF